MPKIYLAFDISQRQSGWGVASKYLLKELNLRISAPDLREQSRYIKRNNTVDGKIFHAIKNINMEPAMSVRGDYNAGYCFYELAPTLKTVLNAKTYDHIFCGSTYNRDVLADNGVVHTSVLLQGVDTNIFHPPTKDKDKQWRDKFVIFSGGKYEYRKGQDLVLAAFKVLQHKYKDLHLVTTWENPWDFSRDTMGLSKHINGKLPLRSCWEDMVNAVCASNRIFPNRTWHYPLVDQRTLYSIIRNSDLGVFPNRCEGGTNLVMMEYMACGKPVIASYNTGHRDVLDDNNAMLLKDMTATRYEPHPEYYADWYDPSLDELIAKIEWAYENRSKLSDYGKAATVSMRNFTWAKTAQHIMDVMLA